MQIQIGPHHHIADEHGTHQPSEVINFPSAALVSLAQRAHDGDKTAYDPETGIPYATIVGLSLPTPPEPPAPPPAAEEPAAAEPEPAQAEPEPAPAESAPSESEPEPAHESEEHDA